MNAKELDKLLRANGWEAVRQSGSHLVYKHPAKPVHLSVPQHGKKDIPIGTLKSILKKAGL